MTLSALKGVALLTFFVPFGVIVYALSAVPAVMAPNLGERGRKRRVALEAGGLFSATEPLVRQVAGWVGHLELAKARDSLEEFLRSTGYEGGLSPDELIACMALSCGAMAAFALGACSVLSEPWLGWTLLAALTGPAVPYLQLREKRNTRFKRVGRGLPPAIDLVALCMGAGSDFPSSVRFVVRETVDTKDPVREEFVHILSLLDLGHTRAYALRNFAERVPTEAVRDFVNAVVQAEEKGNPLAGVLTIQATMLRMRRSVAAEEAAARAGIMLIGPLMILLFAIMLILFSPFVINGIGF